MGRIAGEGWMKGKETCCDRDVRGWKGKLSVIVGGGERRKGIV